jgi:hypothetical protein
MMIKATISNDALRTRIQALRKTSANTLVSTRNSTLMRWRRTAPAYRSEAETSTRGPEWHLRLRGAL